MLTKQEKNKIAETEMKYFGKVSRIWKLDRIRIEIRRGKLKMKSILKFIEIRQLG